MAEDSQTYVTALNDLASVQSLEGQSAEAATIYVAIERATEKWEPRRRGPFLANFGRIETLYRTGHVDDGLAIARQLLDFRITRYGELNSDTALARGHYAVGLALAKRDDEARKKLRRRCRSSATTFNTDTDGVLKQRHVRATLRWWLRIISVYSAGWARPRRGCGEQYLPAGEFNPQPIGAEGADRGRARMTTNDAKLAAALRQEQDLRQQMGTQLGQLNALLAQSPAERDDAGVAAMRKEIDIMRADHLKVRADIDRRFPDYSELIDPKPPTAAQIKEMLKPGETLLSFYSVVMRVSWAISQDGKAEFVALREPAAAIEGKIKKLREALEPTAAMISDIPAFDLGLSHDLYKTLLEPVKAEWGNATSLIVVTNGALGLLPLGVRPRRRTSYRGRAALRRYRAVPWLSRTHD